MIAVEIPVMPVHATHSHRVRALAKMVWERAMRQEGGRRMTAGLHLGFAISVACFLNCLIWVFQAPMVPMASMAQPEMAVPMGRVGSMRNSDGQQTLGVPASRADPARVVAVALPVQG